LQVAEALRETARSYPIFFLQKAVGRTVEIHTSGNQYPTPLSNCKKPLTETTTREQAQENK
jgi:hypothetical protein